MDRIDQATGRIYCRRSTVRRELFLNGRGFICVNNGAAFASQLATYLQEQPDQAFPRGRADPVCDSPPGAS